MGNLLLGARDDDGGGWAEAKDAHEVDDEPRSRGCSGRSRSNNDGGVLQRSSSGLSFGSGDGGANGNTAAAAAAKKRLNPRRGDRGPGPACSAPGRHRPPPRTRHARRRRGAPRSTSANWPPNGPQSSGANAPPVGSQSTNAPPAHNADTSTRPAAAMFLDSLFNTSGGDFDPWSAMGGAGFTSLAGAGAETKSVATGVERQKSLGSIGGSRSRFGFVLDDGEGGVDEDTNTQTHAQTAQASSTQVVGGALLSSGGGVLP